MFAGDFSIIFSLKHQITTLVQDRQKSIWKADVGLCELFPCVAVISYTVYYWNIFHLQPTPTHNFSASNPFKIFIAYSNKDSENIDKNM